MRSQFRCFVSILTQKSLINEKSLYDNFQDKYHNEVDLNSVDVAYF